MARYKEFVDHLDIPVCINLDRVDWFKVEDHYFIYQQGHNDQNFVAVYFGSQGVPLKISYDDFKTLLERE